MAPRATCSPVRRAAMTVVVDSWRIRAAGCRDVVDVGDMVGLEADGFAGA